MAFPKKSILGKKSHCGSSQDKKKASLGHFMGGKNCVLNNLGLKMVPVMHKQLFSVQPELENVVEQSKERSQREGRHEYGDEPVLDH